MYDLIIIGGGPAGASGAVYAARKQLKTLQVAVEWGGQSNVSEDIQNWIGTPNISGSDLAKSFQNHVKAYEGEFLKVLNDKVIKISKENNIFTLNFESGKTENTKAVLICSGSSRRKLPVNGADKFENKGITYCASCDGPLYSDADVVVVGGGNAAFETAAQLSAYCKNVTLINRSETFRADEITVESLKKTPNVTIITNVEFVEVVGDQFVNGLVYKDLKNDETKTIPTTGIFVEIGQLPNSDFVKDIVELNESNNIKIDPWTCRTNIDGIWAAGDVTNILYHQNNIASGEAVKALEDIYMWLHRNK